MGAHRAAMELSGQNATNAATVGYSRRRGTLSSLGLGAGRMTASGVNLEQPRRVVDLLSNRTVRQAREEVSFHQGRRATLETIEAVVAPEGAGLAAALDGFFDAFGQLSSRPDGDVERAEVVHRGQVLSESFRQTRAELDAMRGPVEQTLRDGLQRVNALSERVARINGDLAVAEVGDVEAAELRDERDKALDELSGLIGARVIEHGDGAVSVSLASGASLVSGARSSKLQLQVVDDRLDLRLAGPGGPPVALRAQDARGEVGGLIKAHDEDIRGAIEALDALAFGLAGAVDELHRQGVGLDGATGRAFFEGVDEQEGAAGRIDVSAAITADPGAIAATRQAGRLPGGSELSIELAEVRERAIGGLAGRSVEEALTALQISAGQAVDQTFDGLESAEARAQTFESLRESTRGVSLDEEMADLVKFQQGFEAASRLVRVADELMQTVLGMI